MNEAEVCYEDIFNTECELRDNIYRTDILVRLHAFLSTVSA